MHFRQATTGDLDMILAIENQSFKNGIKESPQVFLERIEVFPEGFLLLETDESADPIGYICSELWSSKKDLSAENLSLGHSIKKVHSHQGQELYVSSMGVLPEYRGRGYGGRMLRHLITKASKDFPQVNSVLLIVSEKWPAARKTYLKLGFEQVDLIPAFFQPVGLKSEPGIVMKKML
ncbi:GNAT family N-acetyltransferase [Desulforamulus aeronauticus]|nr:N-acetyltransferase [Desulforamulus aeronauticus]